MSFKKNFNLLNHILGWVVTAVALVVYGLTMEDTVSFWDCGEFIASAHKLQVGHPPGAPLFALLGRLFIILGGDNPSTAAVMVNWLSVVGSALTIGFLFWTITGLVQKIYKVQDNSKEVEWSAVRLVETLGAALVGSLAYTFSDTFWFSAVEGEVYATSSLFTAVVFWAMLKWDSEVDRGEAGADRWIILIAYLMGLSIGVHLLNLLTIPAIGLLYYYKKYKVSNQGLLYALMISAGILVFVQYGIIPGTIKFTATFERFFTNSLQFSFGTGFLVSLLILALGLAAGIYYTQKTGKALINLGLWAVTVIIVGYSSYGVIFIRSMANTPMDENNPEDVYSMISYLNRDQYGDRPLFYGQYFDASLVDISEGNPIRMKLYVVKDEQNNELASFGLKYDADSYLAAQKNKASLRIDHEYQIIDYKPKYTYQKTRQTVFPRMYSPQGSHVNAYRDWTGLSKSDIPSGKENLSFFFNYQVRWMYFRYFFWNFVGRENDAQGHGEQGNGHWISGISFIDEMITGIPQDNQPEKWANNAGRNTYYFLPLILGLLGLAFQIYRDPRGAAVVGALFFLTGLAIVIYLNQTPYQPRERDYAYAGSFYAFCIWVGMGVLALIHGAQKYLNKTGVPVAVASTVLALAMAPVLFGFQNWDDHNRSNRYTARDFAYNYLNSCEKNAVLFTNGDNDTFPLWYLQEVEGVRTDVRVVNLSLLNTDWYINQMKRKAYDGDPVQFSLTEPEYRGSMRDQVLLDRSNDKYYTVQEHLDWLRRTDGKNKTTVQGGERLYYLKSNKFILPIDSAKVVEAGLVTAEQMALLPKELRWEVPKSYVLKSEVMLLDLLASFKWDRPLSFSVTVGTDNYLGLEKFFRLDGLAYRLMPMEMNPEVKGQTGGVGIETTYKNFMESFKWGNMNGDGVYLDETNLRMTMNFRSNFVRLATALLNSGDKVRAEQVLDRALELMPDHKMSYDYFNVLMADLYRQMGKNEKALKLANELEVKFGKEQAYLRRVRMRDAGLNQELQRADYFVQAVSSLKNQIQSTSPTGGK
jgi:hypothetical protein